jgi:hypothetical protein
MPNQALIQQAKERLRVKVQHQPWYRSIGVAPRGNHLILRLNVAPTADDSELPHEFEGIPIEIVRLEGYEPRGG